MYRQDLALNNLQWLICHKNQPNQTKQNTQVHLYRHAKSMTYIEMSLRIMVLHLCLSLN